MGLGAPRSGLKPLCLSPLPAVLLFLAVGVLLTGTGSRWQLNQGSQTPKL